MTTKAFGQRIKRNEDPRLLTGQGNFIDDIDLQGMLEAAIVTSPYASARITRIDTSRAKAAPGVHLVLTWADLSPALQAPMPVMIPNPSLKHGRGQYVLAKEEIRYQGEIVAMVVAETRYQAEDAAELIDVEYEPLPAVIDLHDSLSEGAHLVHADAGTNIAAHFEQEIGNAATGLAGADRILRHVVRMDRGTCAPIECRGTVAQWNRTDKLLTVWDTSQAPIAVKNSLCNVLGLPDHSVRVVAPDIGGGFGTKVLMFYPEEWLVPYAAMRLGRPVKWLQDRREYFLGCTHERAQEHQVEVAVKNDGTILGLRDHFLYECGAYTPYGIICAIVTSATIPGPYRIPNLKVSCDAVFTNRQAVSPYRGAGRPHAVYAMERTMDLIARELGLEPTEVRRKNLIQPDEFPYRVGIINHDTVPVEYDSGNYPAVIDKLMEMVDLPRFRAEQERLRAQGRYRGLGVAMYVEATGSGPYEGSRIKVQPSGKVLAVTGVGTQGQGHETTFAQIVADQLGVKVEDVQVVTGDSHLFSWGTGTFASRGAVVAGNAIHLAAHAVRERAIEVAAVHLEAAKEDIVLENGRIGIHGAPARSVSLGELAAISNPIRGILPPGMDPGLEATRYYCPQTCSYANGAHAVEIEVDAKTGMMEIIRYLVVHDCGNVINPMIVEGQIHGGVAQGIGGAFYEKLVWDENGQLLTASFMDYLLPTAMEVPNIEVAHLVTPSPLNELGVKGCGEGGVIPVSAAVASALDDALRPFHVTVAEMPMNPEKVLALLDQVPKRTFPL